MEHMSSSSGQKKRVLILALSKKTYDLGISENSGWHHKGLVGSILAALIEYSNKMEWGRVLIHFGYLIIALHLVFRAYGKGI